MSIIFPASLGKLQEMLQFITEQANGFGFSSSITSKIELALEEAIVNIIKHGYLEEVGTIEIKCTQLSPREGLKIELKDQGALYNPLKISQTIDSILYLKEGAVGGQGIRLFFKIMDDVTYRRENDCNILTLIKYK